MQVLLSHLFENEVQILANFSHFLYYGLWKFTNIPILALLEMGLFF